MESHINQAFGESKVSRDWGQTQRTNLKRLIDSVVARRKFDPLATALTKKIQGLLVKNEPVRQPVRESSVAAFAKLSEGKEGLSLQHIAAQALKLYQATVDSLPPMALKKIGALSGPSIAYENRPILKASQEIDAMARQLQADQDPELRSRGQALWLSSRLLAVTAPPADQFRTNKCVFCYRYTTLRMTCKVHRVQGRYTAALPQRGKFSEAMADANRRFETYVKKFPQDLRALEDPRGDAEAVTTLKRVAGAVLDQVCQNTLALAIERSGGEDATLSSAVATWHRLPEVSDDDGLSAMGQSDLGIPIEFMEHLIRFDAFMRMGGEVKRRPRVILSEGPDIQRVFALRDEGKSQVETAKALGISITQLRRIERDQLPVKSAPAKRLKQPSAPRATREKPGTKAVTKVAVASKSPRTESTPAGAPAKPPRPRKGSGSPQRVSS